jgi:acyl-CoA thioester hydrolase
MMMETYRGVVYPNQLDHMGHMNVQWYVSKFDEATWHLFSSIGISTDYIRKNNKGMAAVEQITKYKMEAVAGDLIVVRSKVLEVKNKIVRYLHVMYNAETNEEIANTELVAAHIDTQARKACPLPDDIKKNCLKFMDNTA